jgi:F-type H+-transporting ATPase subunit delta
VKNSGAGKIAERYVDALFAAIQSPGSLALVEKDMLSLAELIKENADFRAFLTNPLLSRDAQETIVSNLMEKLGVQQATGEFTSLLARNKRLDILAEIIEIFLKKAAANRGEISAELVTAREVSAKQAESVAQSLEKAYGKKVNLSTREDPSLLGGSIINIGSLQLDSSIAGKLNRLQQELKTA